MLQFNRSATTVYSVSEILRPLAMSRSGQKGIVENRFWFAEGTTTQHQTRCILTDPAYDMSEILRPLAISRFGQTGIAENRFLFAGGTTTQHQTSRIVTYPAHDIQNAYDDDPF